jgi:hypothetical protein
MSFAPFARGDGVCRLMFRLRLSHGCAFLRRQFMGPQTNPLSCVVGTQIENFAITVIRSPQPERSARNREGKTIHRLPEVDPRSGGFKRNADNSLDCDLLVVDEASMIDVMLIRALGRRRQIMRRC